MEQHLTDEQMIELLASASRGDTDLMSNAQNAAKQHLESCENCKELFKACGYTESQLSKLIANDAEARHADCPRETVWIEIASGIHLEHRMELLEHAAKCDHCGPLLRDELRLEEEIFIDNLSTSAAEWQKEMALKLSAATRAEQKKTYRIGSRLQGFVELLSVPKLVAVVGLIGFIALPYWEYQRQRTAQLADQVVAEAYIEKRTLEFRFQGMPHAVLQMSKDDSIADFDPVARPKLTEAIFKSTKELRSNPQSVEWSQARARARLLVGTKSSIEAALTDLEKLHGRAPSNSSVSTDLATAYVLYGETLDKRLPEFEAIQRDQYSKARELLGPIVEHDRDNEVAFFNNALVLEKMGFLQVASDQWTRYLKDHKNSPWAIDARENLARIQDKLKAKSGRSDIPLKSVDQVSAAFKSNDAGQIAEIDSRIEEYQDIAVQKWLPMSFSVRAPERDSDKTVELALRGLALLLKQKHGDPWLQDMTNLDYHSSALREAVSLLGDSLIKIESSNESVAEREAAKALQIFQEAKNVPGASRSRLILVLADQYGHRNLPCLIKSRSLLQEKRGMGYPWIMGQAEVELAICSPIGQKDALTAIRAALNISKKHRFQVLALRASTTTSSLYSGLGDSRRAWSAAVEALQTYWKGSYPRLRGYNALIAMDEVNFPQNRWYVEEAILKEAMPLVEGDPRKMMVAVEESRLGQALIETYQFDEAEKSFRKTQELLDQSPPGLHHDALSAEAELGFAKVDLRTSKVDKALARLNRIRPIISRLPDDVLELDFYETCGIAELRSKNYAEADRDLVSAIDIAESNLGQIDSEVERLRWSRHSEEAYRALVELKLNSSVQQALQIWEWYQGAALRKGVPRRRRVRGGFLPQNGLDRRSIRTPDSAVLTFVSLPEGYAVWVWDRNDVKEVTLLLNHPELSSLVTAFSAECADPSSDISLLRAKSAMLYQKLILPLEPWLSGRRRILVEPDGALKGLPIALLVDSSGRYFGDKFEIAISPGTAYLDSSRPWTGIDSFSSALVIDAPEALGRAPLQDAEREAQFVAGLFHFPRIITQDSLPDLQLPREIEIADVFHFSGHAHASVESVGLATRSLGLLDSEQLSSFRIGRTQLVVLSACSTSRGTSGYFDDDDSMVRLILASRVPAVVASRWAVDSTATAKLMERFYSEILQGRSVSEALRTATQSVRDTQGYSHPYYWAGFSVFGNA